MKKILSLVIVLALALSFTAFASEVEFKLEEAKITTFDTNAIIPDGSVNVTAGEKVVYLYFSDAVDGISVYDNTVIKTIVNGEEETLTIDEDFEASTMEYGTVEGIDDEQADKIVVITLNEVNDLGYTYVINYSGYENFDGTKPTNNPATFTFTVESEPKVSFSEPYFESGVGTDNPKDSEGEIKFGELQGIVFEAKNNTASSKKVTSILTFYDSDGLLKKVVSSEKTVLAGATDQVSIGTKLPSDAKKVKLFLWGDMTNDGPLFYGQSWVK